MGIKNLLGMEDTEPKKKKIRAKPCVECERFRFMKDIDLAAYRREWAGAKAQIVFILTPLDFDALEKKQWKHIICSALQEFNVAFLPYPRCVESWPWPGKTGAPIWRGCRENFILKQLAVLNPDLVVVTPDTEILLEQDGGTGIEHPGNWEEWCGYRVYLAKKLWNPLGGFWKEGFDHTTERIKRYFVKELFWQKKKDFRLIKDMAGLDWMEEQLLSQDAVAVDVETSGLDVLDEGFRLKTVGIFWPGGAGCMGYEVPECVDVAYQARVRRIVEDLFCDKHTIKICHNLKYEMKVYVRKFELTRFELCEDTMFLAYLFDENRASNGLKWLAGEFFDGYPKTMKDFAGMSLEDLWQYNCLDAAYTFKLWAVEFDLNKLGNLKAGIEYVYKEVMLPFCREIALLEMRGVKLDYEYVAKLKNVLEGEVAEVEEKIRREYPQTIGKDLDSPKQLADVLFSMLRFPQIKPTKTGASTDKETLVTLKEKYNCLLAGYILEYRKKAKQLSTYVLPYLEKRSIFRGDRIRSNYAQTKNFMAAKGEAKGTIGGGRISSANPNLQNISRDKRIKRQFIPSEKGRVLLQADLNQAELRIGASLANEEVMLDVYAHDGDIHEKTGMSCSPRAYIDKYMKLAEGPEKKIAFKGIRQNGKCFACGTKIVTSRGILPVEDFVPSINQGFTSPYYGNVGCIADNKINSIGATFFDKVSVLVEFELENGDVFRVTRDHLMVVRRKEKIIVTKAEDIVESDEFVES